MVCGALVRAGKARRNVFAALVGTTALIAVNADAGPARAQSATTGAQDTQQSIAFAIPPQPLASAIVAFSRATGINVAAGGTIPANVRSPGLRGMITPAQGMTALLAGTGYTYRFRSPGSVTLIGPSDTGAAASVPGAVALDAIDVAGGSSQAATDKPYQTPGSVSHISREQIDRVPPTSPGDIFTNTPGVINAGNRVGTSVNPNIRGLQGMERVKVTVDGAEQTTSSYRGYIGNRDETYIDPDMIGGVDITKGPSNGPSSAIGGTVAVRTLTADDIIKDGKSWGVRLKGSLGNNTAEPPAPYSGPLYGTGPRIDHPSFFNGDTWSGSIAGAVNTESFEGVAAFSKRNQGNYFVGAKVPDGIRFPGQTLPNTIYFPGSEAFNTSENTESALLKGKLKWGDGQSLELGYLMYDSLHGEINELLFAPWFSSAQQPLAKTRVDTYTAKYRWNPAGNDLINFRANLWLSDVDDNRSATTWGPEGSSQMRTTGGDLGNTSLFDTAIGKLSLDYGLSFAREHATALQTFSVGSWSSLGPSGVRTTVSGYSSAKLDITHWLTLSAGLRYDDYESRGEGYMAQYPETSGSRASPNYGVTITPAKGLQFFALYKEGMRPPTLRESFWNYGTLLVANPYLKPEISKNKEFGFNLLRNDIFTSGDKFRFKASYFDNRYDDYIIRQPVTGGGSPYHFDNIDHANYRGYELSGSYDAGVWFTEAAFTKYLTVEYCPAGGACFTPGMGGVFASGDPLRNDYVSNYIPPEYSGSLTAGVRLFDQKLTLGGRMTFAGIRFGSSWEAAKNGMGQVGYQFTWPSYQVYDFFGSYKFTDDVILNFSIENITNQYYFGALSSIGIPSPGRTGRVSMTLRF